MSVSSANDVGVSIAEALPAGAAVEVLRRIAGGTSHETWACDVTDGAGLHPLVVRREIGDGVLDGNGDAEFALLRRLHALGAPVPRPWLRIPAREGYPAMTLLERIAGEDLRKLLARGAVPDRRALGLAVVSIQAKLHAIDGRRELANELPRAASEIDDWAARIAAHRSGPEPLLTAAVSWLRAHAPRAAERALVHADFKANNLLVSPDGRVTVIDWELAHAGDPIEDLAWTLFWDTEHDVVPGLLDRSEYLAAYEHASGRSVEPSALFFWELFSLVKLAAIFLAGVRPGMERRPTLMMLGRATPVLEARIAARLIEALDRGLA